MNFAERFLTLSILWGCLSSVAALILIKSGVHSELVFAIKDAPVYLCAALLSRQWLGARGGVAGALLIGLLLVVLFANFYLLNPNYAAPLKNIRQIVAPVILLLVYCKLRVRRSSVPALTSWLCYTVIAVLAFGVFEQALELWKLVGLKEYFNLKGIPTDASGLSYMFYEPLFNYRERMTSTFLDPISLGHFFATAAIFLYYLPDKSKLAKTALGCCFAGLILTLSKGALLQLFFGLCVLNPRVPLILRFALITVPFLVVASLGEVRGISIHVNGFLNSLKTITLFGHGIGSVGNYTKMFSDDMLAYMELGVSDTFVGAILGQVGAVGFAIWAGIVLYVVFGSAASKSGAVASLRILASIFLIAVLSENTMNVTSFLVPAAIIGLAQTALSRPVSPLSRGSHSSASGSVRHFVPLGARG